MKRKMMASLAGLMAVATLAAPAAAQVPVCAGTTSTAYVCIEPTGQTLITDCVYVGPPPCTPVSVPGPTVTCGGALISDLRCPAILQ